jgi:hypothetical protein
MAELSIHTTLDDSGIGTYVADALRSLTSYPIPQRTILEIAVARGLSLEDGVTPELRASAPFQLARADTMLWLSTAPDVSQGGISYSFSTEQRTTLRQGAMSLYFTYGEDAVSVPKSIYGYKGDRL